jgi:ribosome-associated toxin RatA of RatAB toxin-antitoxin module
VFFLSPARRCERHRQKVAAAMIETHMRMRSPWRALLMPVVLLGVLLGGAPAWASATWEQVTEVKGIRVEHRSLPGTGRYEIRASTSAPFPPQVIFETLWRHHEYPTFVPYLKHLAILQQSPNEKVIYEQITMPFVQDRDYTVKVTAEQEPATGRIQVAFVSAPDEGPPAQAPYVRVTGIQGSWTLVPTRDGGSLVTYVVTSDPGGALPTWLVNMAQRKAVPALVKAMLDRVKHNVTQEH